MNKIYYVKIYTTNPSANVDGYFDTEELAKEETKRMQKVIENSPEYYGKWIECDVEERVIHVTNKLES